MIEVAPLAFMRGRTLNDAFVILDEAQNTTSEQMKMFLTRLGFGSKAVVTGDITQIDLPNARMSGLVEALKIVKDVDGIGFVYFDDKDVVRHKLVQQIVKAYEAFSNGSRSQWMRATAGPGLPVGPAAGRSGLTHGRLTVDVVAPQRACARTGSLAVVGGARPRARRRDRRDCPRRPIRAH